MLLFVFSEKYRTFRRNFVVWVGADVVMLEPHLRIHLYVGGISSANLDVVFVCCFHTRSFIKQG